LTEDYFKLNKQIDQLLISLQIKNNGFKFLKQEAPLPRTAQRVRRAWCIL